MVAGVVVPWTGPSASLRESAALAATTELGQQRASRALIKIIPRTLLTRAHISHAVGLLWVPNSSTVWNVADQRRPFATKHTLAYNTSIAPARIGTTREWPLAAQVVSALLEATVHGIICADQLLFLAQNKTYKGMKLGRWLLVALETAGRGIKVQGLRGSIGIGCLQQGTPRGAFAEDAVETFVMDGWQISIDQHSLPSSNPDRGKHDQDSIR